MKKVTLTRRFAKNHSSVQRISLLFVCLLCLIRTGFAQVDLDNGLIAYLPLNGNGNDQSGNNNPAVNSPGTTQTFIGADRFLNFPGAMRFAGESGQSKMTFGTPLLSNRNAYSISFWFSIASAYSGGTMSVFGQDNLLEIGYALSPNRLVVYHPVSGTVTVNMTSPYYNVWQHLVITGNGTEMKIYLNGAPVSTYTGNYSLGANSSTTNIGGHVMSQTGTEWMKGHLDDLRIYSRVVTSDEVSALFAENQPGITINSINATSFCAGDDVSVSFSAAGNIQTDNVYSLQLSQPDGTFTRPIVLGTLASNALSGTFNAEIPTGVYSGTGYKLRIVSSNMSAVSNETGMLTITSILGNLSNNSTYYFIGNVNGKNYYRSTGSSTGANATTTSIANNGQLATVYDAAVNRLFQYNSRDTRVYIGLNDVAQEGTFVWRDGTAPTYTNWASGQPDNSGNEDYVELRSESGLWNDISETESKPHFMELLPVTANQTVCTGSSLNLQAKPIAGALYSWTGPNGFSSISQNPTISNSTSATAGVYVVTYSLNGCTVSDSATIAVNPLTPNDIGQSSTVLNTLNNGLVLHYGLNGNANDASGNGLNGTLVGGVTPRTDRFGNANAALQLNGTNGYVDVPDGVYFTSADFTVTAWVRKVSNNSWSRLFDFGNGPQNNNVLVGISSLTSGKPAGQVYVGTVGGATVTSPVTLANNQWRLLTYVYSNGSAELSIDGVVVAQGAQSIPANVVRTMNYIGRSNWSSDGYSNAGFDDFRIYNRKLSAAEIQSLVMEQPNPLAASVLPGVFCNGTAQIALLHSQPGVTYQLINANTQASVGAAQPGTGDTLIFTTGVLTGATDFQFSAQSIAGCSIILDQTITVTPQSLPAAPTAHNDSVCNEGVLTISVSGGTNYLWYSTLTGGTPLSSITGSSFTTGLIDETANYYVSAVDNSGCESARTLVSAVVLNPLHTLLNIESGLILHYPFQNNLADSSGNGYSATASGAITFISDRDGNALSALNTTASGSGGNNYLSAGNPAKIQQLTNKVTISMWIRQTQTWFGSDGTGGFMPLVNKWSGGTGMYLALHMQNPANMSNRVRWRINGGAIVEGNTNVPVGQWHHIVCVYDGSYLRIYQNGVLTGQTPMTGGIPNTPVNLLLGKQADGYGEITYRGDLDEVKIYNRSLNANEIQTLFNHESVAFVNGPFCDGEGDLQLTTFNFPGASYQWSGPNGFSSTQQNPTVIPHADSATYAGLYTLQVTANGCTAPVQETTAFIYGFPADPNVTNDTVCGSGSAILTASGAGTGAHYNWYTVPAGGTPIPGQTSATLTLTNVPATTVRYVSITRNGCESNRSEVKAIYFNDINTNLSVTGSSVCASALTADVTVVSSESGVSYQAFLGSNPVSPVVSGGGDITLAVTTSALSLGTNPITIKASYPSCGAVSLATTATVTIFAVPGVTTTPSGATAICQGSSINLAASAGSAYLWNTGETTATIEVQAAGDYSVTVTDVNGCSNTSTPVAVSVDQQPVPVIASAGPTTFCDGGSVVLTASGGTNFLWNTNETSTSITVSQPGTYHFTAFNGACSAVSPDVAVTVNPLPMVTATATAAAICSGETVTLTGSGATSYSWDNGVSDGVSFAPAATTTYTVTGTGANNCSATASVTITVHDLPNAAFTPEFATFCAGTTGMDLTAAVSSYTDYDWFQDGNPLQLNGTSVQAITSPGTYGLTVTDVSGCTNSSTVTINSGPAPVVSISAPAASFCSGSSETITAVLIPGGIYTWYKDGSPVTAATPEDVSFVAASAGIYTLEVENTSGCTGTSNPVSLAITALPTVVISSTATSMCAGGSILLQATDVAGATYQWLQNSGPISGAVASTYTATTAGDYQVQLTDGCTGISNTIAVTITPLPSNPGAIDGFTSVCAGETEVFSISPATNAVSYDWTITPTGSASIGQGQGTTSITVNSTNSNFTVHVTPQNTCGTGTGSNLNVNVTTTGFCATEVLFAANTTQLCAGSEAVFTNYTDPNLFLGLTPHWNFGAGASPATATGNGPHTVTYLTQGLKTVTLDYEDAFGNSFANETKVDYVDVSGAVSTSPISGNTTVSCTAANEPYSVVLTPGSDYQWSVPAGAVILSGQGTSAIAVNFNGHFGVVSVVETNSGGCQGAAMHLSVSCNLGLEESEAGGVAVYPNPASESFRIVFPQAESAELLLFDANGKLVKTQPVYSLETVSIRELEPAVYIGKVVFANRQAVLFRLVKQ